MKKSSKLFTALIFMLFFKSSKLIDHNRDFFLVLTPKTAVFPFFYRMSLNDHHVSVVKVVPSSAIKMKEVTLPPGSDLFLAELKSIGESALTGEIGRMESIAAVALSTRSLPHIHNAIGDHVSLNRVSVDDLIEPSSLTNSSRFSAISSLHGNRSLWEEVPSRSVSINSEILQTRVAQLSGASTIQINGTEHRILERATTKNKNLARAFLTEQLTASGFLVSESKYSTGVNLIADFKGQDSTKFIILSGHLDSMNNAGADDDASGVVSAWTIAEELAKSNPRISIRFVAFDQEELGLVGSKAYAKSLSQSGGFSGLMGVFNIEMTGYDSNGDGAIHVIDCDENTSSLLSEKIVTALSVSEIDLKVIDACTNRSDHASFWQYDQPAIVIAQNFFGPPSDANPCYHKSCDKVDKMNFDYMTKITNLIFQAVAAIAI